MATPGSGATAALGVVLAGLELVEGHGRGQRVATGRLRRSVIEGGPGGTGVGSSW